LDLEFNLGLEFKAYFISLKRASILGGAYTTQANAGYIKKRWETRIGISPCRICGPDPFQNQARSITHHQYFAKVRAVAILPPALMQYNCIRNQKRVFVIY
jgi:hypothetical protein